MDLLTEIAGHRARMRRTAAAHGVQLMAPLLVLGTSERVGSNWLSDTLRAALPQHNEPLRQQISAAHPLSVLNPNPAALNELTDETLGIYGRHWLASFAAGKYGPVRHVVKETNLYFTVDALLRLLPDAPIVVASRSPLGVASSFTRSGLFARWDYPTTYRRLATMTRTGGRRRYAPLMGDDEPDPLVALVRMVVLNTLLLAEATAGRPAVHVPYESTVADHATTLAELSHLVEAEIAPPCPAGLPQVGTGDDTFATTNAKTDLIAYLDVVQARQVAEHTASLLEVARTIVSAPVADTAAGWLAGGHHYQLAGAATAPRARTRRPTAVAPVGVAWVRRGPLSWRNLLVSNAEYTAFLNALAAAGLANTTTGTHLLAIPMPSERGGRLHTDAAGSWRVDPGYEQHPVYWVSWIGAAAYAAHRGARLPRRAEMIALVDELHTDELMADRTNAGYRVGDVVPVTEPGLPATGIHHPVGNVQVWCADGPDETDLLGGPAARFLHGAAWNTPASPTEIRRARHRHPSGASRGVGIRLVRDGAQQTATAADLAVLLRTWIASLADRRAPLAVHDAGLIAVLSGLQPNGRLRPHVGAGAGEPGLAELNEPLGEAQ